MEEAKVLKWAKSPGDPVSEGDVLVELETDKAALEVEATASGVFRECRVQEGETVPVGSVLAILDEHEGATAAPFAGTGREEASAAAPGTRPPAPGSPLAVGGTERSAVLRRPKPAPRRKVLASPLARRIASQAGLLLDGIVGSGPHGRIRRRDVERALNAPQAVASPVADQRQEPGTTGISAMRRRIAEQVAESRRTIPSFALDRWVDLEAADEARASMNRRLEDEGGPRLTFTDFILQALGDVLPRHPRLMTLWAETADGETSLDAPAVGLVVGLAEGLMIPVLKDLAGKGLAAIAGERQGAVRAAQQGRLGSKHSGTASISLSNIGRLGADRFEAIINPGESAILAVGRIRQTPVARGRALSVSRGATLTLSVDHRVIDGLVGAAFLGDLADRIEHQTWRL